DMKLFSGSGQLALRALSTVVYAIYTYRPDGHCGRKPSMSGAHLVVRAEVPDPADRAPFDHWYATDHLPWAIRVFGARRGWRCWSRTEPAVHYASYELADVDEARASTGPDKKAPPVRRVDPGSAALVPRLRESMARAEEVRS